MMSIDDLHQPTLQKKMNGVTISIFMGVKTISQEAFCLVAMEHKYQKLPK